MGIDICFEITKNNSIKTITYQRDYDLINALEDNNTVFDVVLNLNSVPILAKIADDLWFNEDFDCCCNCDYIDNCDCDNNNKYVHMMRVIWYLKHSYNVIIYLC